MRVLLVMNEASGSGTARDEIEALIVSSGGEIVETDADRVVVAGGDGTVAQGAELAARLDVPLGVLPTGTANDFARVHGLCSDLDEAVVTALRGGLTRHDLARLDGRPFVNVAAAGLAPAAAERAAPLKPVLGALSYVAGAVMAGIREEPIAVVVDGHFEGEAWQVIVACSGAFGGGAEIDAAESGDAELDLVVVPEGSRAELAARALRMRRGDLADADGVLHARAAAFTLRVPAGTRFNVDGELVEAGPVVEATVTESFRLSAEPPVR